MRILLETDDPELTRAVRNSVPDGVQCKFVRLPAGLGGRDMPEYLDLSDTPFTIYIIDPDSEPVLTPNSGWGQVLRHYDLIAKVSGSHMHFTRIEGKSVIPGPVKPLVKFSLHFWNEVGKVTG